MKTSSNVLSFKTNATNEIRQSQILATPGMFKIMYDQLYSRKEEAVVRELMSNAWDAHEMSGTQRPMKISMPTTLDPTLTFEDYGPGLDEEGINMLYDYGATNKTHTNQVIGGFGLGAKTPFCFTNQFTTISRHGGMARTYAVFLQENGAPGSMIVDERPMRDGEHTGLTISIPLGNDAATHRFAMAVRKMRQFFGKPVLVINNSGYNTDPPSEAPSYTVEVDGYEVEFYRGKNPHPKYTMAWENAQRSLIEQSGLADNVLIGVVPYRLADPASIRTDALTYIKDAAPEHYSMLERLIKTTRFIIKAPIGDPTLTFGPAREQIDDKQEVADLISYLLCVAAAMVWEHESEQLDADTMSLYELCEFGDMWNIHGTVLQQYHRAFNDAFIELDKLFGDAGNYKGHRTYRTDRKSCLDKTGSDILSRLAVLNGAHTIIIMPSKPRHSMQFNAEQWVEYGPSAFEPLSDIRPTHPCKGHKLHFVETKDPQAIVRCLKNAGLEWPVLRAKPTPHRPRQKYSGKQKYDVMSLNKQLIQSRFPQSQTVADTIEELDAHPNNRLWLVEWHDPTIINNLSNAELLEGLEDNWTWACIVVPDNHTKVRRALLEHPQVIGWENFSDHFTLHLDQARAYLELLHTFEHHKHRYLPGRLHPWAERLNQLIKLTGATELIELQHHYLEDIKPGIDDLTRKLYAFGTPIQLHNTYNIIKSVARRTGFKGITRYDMSFKGGSRPPIHDQLIQLRQWRKELATHCQELEPQFPGLTHYLHSERFSRFEDTTRLLYHAQPPRT